MTTLDEVVAAIKKLSPSDRAKLDQILHGLIDDEWDMQMIAGATTGKLDKRIAQVDANIESGNLRNLPQPENSSKG